MPTFYKNSSTFEIREPASITVTNPTSSTVLYHGDTVNITWTTTGTIGNVKIELYDGSNSKTATIASSTPNDGSYSWTVYGSQLSGSDDEYQIKIIEVLGTIHDYSSNFQIYDYRQLITTDATLFSETVITEPLEWKITKIGDDALQFWRDEVLFFVQRSQLPTDATTFSTDSVATDTRVFKLSETATEATTFSADTVSFYVARAKSYSDETLFTDTVLSEQLIYKKLESPTDGIDWTESIAAVSSIYKVLETPSDAISFPGETISVLKVTYKHLEDWEESMLFIHDNVSTEPRTWKVIQTLADVSTFTNDDVSTIKRAYKTIQTAADESTFSGDSVTTSLRTYKAIKSFTDESAFSVDNISSVLIRGKIYADETTFSEDDVSFQTLTYKHIQSISDETSFSVDQVLIQKNVQWRLEEADVSQFTESVVDLKSVWKHNYLFDDITTFSDDIITTEIRDWITLITATDGSVFTESVIFLKTEPLVIDEATTFSDDIIFAEKRTWATFVTNTDDSILTENIADLKSLWKYQFDELENISFHEVVSGVPRIWGHMPTPTDQVNFADDDVTAIVSQWNRIIQEALAFTESITTNFDNLVYRTNTDVAQFIESVTAGLVHSCRVREFSSSGTESFGTVRKTGWLTASDNLNKKSILRRLNVEYNSSDPLNVKIYIDGDNTNPVWSKTIAAATGQETTNKSIRIGQRAKFFMLEVGTDASTNSNTSIEDIGVEIDNG